MNSWEAHVIFLACHNHEYQRIHYDMVEQCWRQQASLNTLVSHMVVGQRNQKRGSFIPVWYKLPMLRSPNICQEHIYKLKKSLLTSWCPVLIRITVQRTLLSLRIVLDGPPFRREKGANPRWRRRENNSALRTEGCTLLYIYYISIRTSTNIPE